MHCIVHPQSEAVGTCGICGAALCHDCFTGSMYTWDGKPLCPSCNVRLVSELAAEARAEAASARFRVLFFLVALGIGTVLAVASGEAFMVFGIAGIGAIPTMWRLTRPTLRQTIEYGVQDGVAQAFGDYSGGFIRFFARLLVVLVLSNIAAVVLFFVAFWKWRKAARQAAELEGDLAAMQEAGWRAAGSLKDAEPADPKTAARIRARHFAGPWKRGAPAPVSKAAPVPAPVACAAAVPPAPVPPPSPPSPPSPGESASARLAARMAAVDARIAARKAAIESSKR